VTSRISRTAIEGGWLAKSSVKPHDDVADMTCANVSKANSSAASARGWSAGTDLGLQNYCVIRSALPRLANFEGEFM
jgi:hypothetical protein